jgi:gluconate kinase
LIGGLNLTVRVVKSHKMKVIIFAPATAGKTTIVGYLRDHTELPVLEVEGEFLRLYGRYPQDDDVRQKLIDQLLADVLGRDEVVLFCNTDFLNDRDIWRARDRDFTIVQLHIDLTTMLVRNKKRVMEEGYTDTSQWFEGMLEYQRELRDKGLVDLMIDARLPVEQVTQQLIDKLR